MTRPCPSRCSSRAHFTAHGRPCPSRCSSRAHLRGPDTPMPLAMLVSRASHCAWPPMRLAMLVSRAFQRARPHMPVREPARVTGGQARTVNPLMGAGVELGIGLVRGGEAHAGPAAAFSRALNFGDVGGAETAGGGQE